MKGWRLSSRMAAMSLLLLLVIQGVMFATLRLGVERNARSQLAGQLAVGERIWARLVEQRAAKLSQGAALLATDYGFRAAVASDDRDTLVSALDNHGARIQASLAALLDPSRRVRAVSRDADSALLPALARAGAPLAAGGHAVALVGGRPVQFVMVPVRSPLLVGWVVMGFELDRAMVDDLHAVSGLHATLVARPAGAAAAVLQSSLPPAAAQALPGAGAEVELGGDISLVRTVAVAAEGDAAAELRLSGSLGDAVRPYRALQVALAALTLLGLAAFGAGSMWTARWVTGPLQSLVRASNRLGRGEYDAPVEHQRREDEIGELAQAFEHMRVNIAAHEREVRQLAYWDRLTGLPNRVQFRDAVAAALAAGDVRLAVVMLDLDRFKHVNDVLGYASGDRLLQGVAARLQQAVREGDTVARLGGDEFALLLPGADAARAQAAAARVAQAFEAPLLLGDQTIDLSAGLGIALAPDHAREADVLLSRAEVAMYVAKRRTAGAQLYDPALDSASAETLSLLGELRQAVERDELRVFLQPKVALADGAIAGAEALVRWQHPTRGLVPPMQFIPFAEQTGFVRRLTLWIFEAVARQQAALAAQGVARVSVNLSTRDLMDLELPARLDAILARHGARAEGFCLEITESAIMDDPERAEGTLNRLAERGFKLSIDDFGTGYSSLAYLKRLPVHELKIDRSFVVGMQRSDGDRAIVRSTIDLAHHLGLRVVAEGVEDEALMQRLQALGCDEAQGYHLSRPLPLADFMRWAGSWAGSRAGAALASA